ATFLTGIFAGSIVGSLFADRIKRPLLWFGVLEILTSCGCLASMYFFQYLPWWNLVFNHVFPNAINISLASRFFLASVILFPLTVFLGLIFPIVIKACVFDLEALGRSVGTAYSANTMGAIAGSVLAGFVLIPWLGVERLLTLTAAFNVGIGLVLVAMEKS